MRSFRVRWIIISVHYSYLNNYLLPFFGETSFAWLNAHLFKQYVAWARKQVFTGVFVGLPTIKKHFVVMRMVCREAAVEHGWGATYNPFFDFRIKENSGEGKKTIRTKRERLAFPFSINEVEMVRTVLPVFWRPLFDFAIALVTRVGELYGLKESDIHLEDGIIKVQRAITLDREGKRIKGDRKTAYSIRDIELTTPMRKALEAQTDLRNLIENPRTDYFFCTRNGNLIDYQNFRDRIWIPSLEKTSVKVRAFGQTRHTLATLALAPGEDPHWVKEVMGHADLTMIICHYGNYTKNSNGTLNGSSLAALLFGSKSNSDASSDER